jgi:hypothetical protein
MAVREGFRRYHVRLGGKRTTATLDKNLSDWLALRLGVAPGPADKPEAPDAHRAVRAWMQAELDRNGDPGRVLVSSWLQRQALEAVVDPELRTVRDMLI